MRRRARDGRPPPPLSSALNSGRCRSAVSLDSPSKESIVDSFAATWRPIRPTLQLSEYASLPPSLPLSRPGQMRHGSGDARDQRRCGPAVKCGTISGAACRCGTVPSAVREVDTRPVPSAVGEADISPAASHLPAEVDAMGYDISLYSAQIARPNIMRRELNKALCIFSLIIDTCGVVKYIN